MSAPAVVCFHATARPISVCCSCDREISGEEVVTVTVPQSGHVEDYCEPCFDATLFMPSA